MMLRRNSKGSALVWAVVISSVLVILIGAALTIAYSFYNRSINTNTDKQAYFTARSVVESISVEIKNETANGNAILDRLVNTGDIVNFDNISFSGISDNNGSTIAYAVLLDPDTIKITATTTLLNRSETVTAVLGKGTGTTLPIGDAFPGLIVPEDTVITDGSVSISNFTATDIYAYGGATVLFLNNANFNGNIYAESGIEINIEQGSKFSGNIFAQSGTIFTFSKLHKDFTGTIFVTNGSVINVNGTNYTITQSGSTVNVSPSGMNRKFASLLSIYTGTDSGGSGWGDTVYE